MKKTTRGALIVGAALLFGGCGGPKAGDSCTENEQQCDGDNRIFTCVDGKLVDSGQNDENTCNCIEASDGCAVIGYIGVTKSGRARTAGRRLRRIPKLAAA